MREPPRSISASSTARSTPTSAAARCAACRASTAGHGCIRSTISSGCARAAMPRGTWRGRRRCAALGRAGARLARSPRSRRAVRRIAASSPSSSRGGTAVRERRRAAVVGLPAGAAGRRGRAPLAARAARQARPARRASARRDAAARAASRRSPIQTRADGRPDAIVARGRTLIPLLAAALAPDFGRAVTRALGAPTIAGDRRARARARRRCASRCIDAALIVLADHELNASSFAARDRRLDRRRSVRVRHRGARDALRSHATAPRPRSIARFADEVGDPDDATRRGARAAQQGRAAAGLRSHALSAWRSARAAAARARPRHRRRPRAHARGGRPRQHAPRAHAPRDRRRASPTSIRPSTSGSPRSSPRSAHQPSAASGLFAVARSAGWLAHVTRAARRRISCCVRALATSASRRT